MIFLKKLVSLLTELLTLYNILSFSLITISLLLIIMILVQKNTDGYSQFKNIFGPNIRIDSQLNVTYSLIFLFVVHIFAITILTNKKYKEESLTGEEGYKRIIENKKIEKD